MAWLDQLHDILNIPKRTPGGYAPMVYPATPEPTKGFTPSWSYPSIVGQRVAPAPQAPVQPLNPVTQAPAGATNLPASGGSKPGQQPMTPTNTGTLGVGGVANRVVPRRYSPTLKAQGSVANSALDQNPALSQASGQPLTPAPVVDRFPVMANAPGMSPEVSPELTAGSQAAAELDAPKNWLQKMASPQGRDFIAMIGQMLAAKGSTYGNEPPASLGYATAARGVTQQALANDWSTRLATDPNAKPPSTLAPESQKQVMSIHEHKAQNEQRKFERQYRMEELDVQKQRLAAQAELDKLETAFKEKELTLREKVANGTLAQQDFENSLMPGKIAIQNKQLQIADIEANTANLRARNEAQFGGMTPAQSAVDRRMMAAQRLKLLEQYSPEEVDQMMADAYGETPRIPAADAPGGMAKPATDRQATLADIQALLQKHPNDPKLLQALEMLKSGKITAIPIKAGSTFYNELVGGK